MRLSVRLNRLVDHKSIYMRDIIHDGKLRTPEDLWEAIRVRGGTFRDSQSSHCGALCRDGLFRWRRNGGD